MSRTTEKVRATGTAALLLVAGMALGIVVDRLVLMSHSAHTELETPALTVESLAERIDLRAEDAQRLRTLLDSLHEEVMAAADAGPEALRAATDEAHHRIEASLDPEARPGFRAWLLEHRQQMMHRMHRDMVGNP